MNKILYNIKRLYRYLISFIYRILFFKFKAKDLYLGSNVQIIGKIILGDHIRVYDNSKILGNISVGDFSTISENVEIRTHFESIIIGQHCSINRNSIILGKVILGDYTMIAPNVVIAGSNHIFREKSKLIRAQGVCSIGIEIGNDVWIGANSVILDGVKIGNGSVIGAGSVVTKNIESYCVAVGNPCKVIRKR